MRTYNKYLTDSIKDGTMKVRECDGLITYQVRAPYKDEVVDGYTNFSSIVIKETDTEISNRIK
jgi:hypothetical protein